MWKQLMVSVLFKNKYLHWPVVVPLSLRAAYMSCSSTYVYVLVHVDLETHQHPLIVILD
jgi:hypothetical protein